MQVTCPNCGARYAVDPLAIGPTGRTVQCVRCSHRWRERPIAPAAVAPLPPRPVPLATPPPKTRWGLWLSIIAAAVVVLGLAVYAFRGEILAALPAEWRAFLHIDALRELFRQ
jgi:predicted Zn finger-like uncharacterized protein